MLLCVDARLTALGLRDFMLQYKLSKHREGRHGPSRTANVQSCHSGQAHDRSDVEAAPACLLQTCFSPLPAVPAHLSSLRPIERVQQ